jgi:hypothetical protein
MGYMSCIGNCVSCNTLISFNPERVPSIRVSRNAEGKWVVDPNGSREPVCENCVERFNQRRKELGQEPFVIPPDAYTAEQVP